MAASLVLGVAEGFQRVSYDGVSTEGRRRHDWERDAGVAAALSGARDEQGRRARWQRSQRGSTIRVSRPHRAQGRDSIQRQRVSVTSPQCSQCCSPGPTRKSRQPAQVRSKLMGVSTGAFPQGLLGRERPPGGRVWACCKCTLLVPYRSSKKGGRSRPPPKSPIGTAVLGIWP